MRKSATQVLLNAVTATGAGDYYQQWGVSSTYHCVGFTSSGAGAATVLVQVSNDGTNWVLLGTFSLTLSTTVVTEGLSSIVPWKNVRGNVTAITGTGATVTLTLGSQTA